MAEQKKLDGNLKRAQKLLKGSNGHWDLSQLVRNGKVLESLAAAVADGSFAVPAKQMRVVYSVLVDEANLSRLSSVAVFEVGQASKDAEIRAMSEEALARRGAKEGGHAELIEELEEALRPSGRPLPMDTPRATAEELARSCGASPEDVVAAMEARIAANSPATVFYARRHADGAYSFSRPGPFELVTNPDPFAIEALVAAGDFEGLDGLLASAKAPRDQGNRPGLTWRNGEEMSAGARDWLIGQAKDQRLGRQVLDLFRDTLTDDAARALAGESDLVCVVPQAAAFAAIGEDAEGRSEEVLDSLADYPGGRRALLQAELAWPQYRHRKSQTWFGRCHDGWPTPEEAGDRLEEWRDRGARFLAAAAEAERTFPAAVFAECYLASPLLGPLVRDGYDPASWAGEGPVVLKPTGGDRGSAAVPDFSQMEPQTRSSVTKALKALGFEFELGATVDDGVDRDRLAREGLRIHLTAVGRRVVVDRVGVRFRDGAHAWALRTDDGLELAGHGVRAEGPGRGPGATGGWRGRPLTVGAHTRPPGAGHRACPPFRGTVLRASLQFRGSRVAAVEPVLPVHSNVELFECVARIHLGQNVRGERCDNI